MANTLDTQDEIVQFPTWEFSSVVEFGDHIAVPIKGGGGWHHGIYYRDGFVVADKERDVDGFLAGSSHFAIVRYKDDSVKRREETVERCRELLSGRLGLVGTYFATYCRSGKAADLVMPSPPAQGPVLTKPAWF